MLPQKAGQVKHICRLKFTILLKGGVDFRSQYNTFLIFQKQYSRQSIESICKINAYVN